MRIHIWNCFVCSKISVDINKDIKNSIKSTVSKDPYNFAKKLRIHPARIYDYFIYQSAPIPLDILLKLPKIIEKSIFDLEKYIILYKQMHVPSKNSIKNPKLPIQITPYLTSLVANLFFDGSMPKDGKGTYYNQKNREIMDDFVKKTAEIFGEVYYSLRIDHRGVLKCRLPRIIGEICRHIYKINSFGTFDSNIPEFLFHLNKEHRISFILAGIIDEGSITYSGDIQFGVSNRNMAIGFKNLCQSIGLETSEVKASKNLKHYHFYIKSKEKFFKVYKEFVEKYPLILLRYKEERLKKYFEIKNQIFYYTKEFADKRKISLLAELKHRESSINFLSNKLLIPPKSIRRYMLRLMEEGKAKRKKIGNEYIYALI